MKYLATLSALLIAMIATGAYAATFNTGLQRCTEGTPSYYGALCPTNKRMKELAENRVEAYMVFNHGGHAGATEGDRYIATIYQYHQDPHQRCFYTGKKYTFILRKREPGLWSTMGTHFWQLSSTVSLFDCIENPQAPGICYEGGGGIW